MPVLWADGAKNISAKDPATGETVVRHDGQGYADVLRGLRAIPGCVGAHLCGAYLRNRCRRRGLRRRSRRPDEEALAPIAKANRETTASLFNL